MFGTERIEDFINAAAIRVSGTEVVRNEGRSSTFGTNIVETRTTTDETAGILFQFGRPVDESDVISAFGQGNRVVVGNDQDFGDLVENLHWAFCRVENSRRVTIQNGEQTNSTNVGSSVVLVGQNTSGGLGVRIGISQPFPCERTISGSCSDFFAQREYSRRSSYNAGPSFFNGSRRYYDRSVGNLNGNIEITDRTHDVALSASTVLAFDDLGPHWEGPSGYDICGTISAASGSGGGGGAFGFGSQPSGVFAPPDPNEDAIRDMMSSDPQNRPGCCGN